MKSDNKEKILRIREVLHERGTTPQFLADRMGVTRQYINNILSERGTASVRVLSRIARILQVPLASLFADYQAPYDSTREIRCPNCRTEIRVGFKEETYKE